MKTKLYCLFITLAWLALPTLVQAQLQDGDYYYSDNGDGTCSVWGYAGSDNDITIPDTLGGLTVTSIGEYALYGATVTSVVIPDTVTNIEDNSFNDCSLLTSVTIPNSVISIEDDAFNSCGQLTSITIPDSVTSIGDSVFTYCTTMGSVSIGNGVTSIGDSAFQNCFGLTNLTIGSSLVSVGDYAFEDCTKLPSVTFPAGVTSIGEAAFTYCSVLTSAYFLGDAPPDDGSIFNGDSATVYYVPGTAGWSTTFGSDPTVLWFLPNPKILASEPSFGVQTNVFGFVISGPIDTSVVVEACTDLSNPTGSRCKRTRSPPARPISAIRSGRIIPAASTASARREAPE